MRALHSRSDRSVRRLLAVASVCLVVAAGVVRADVVLEDVLDSMTRHEGVGGAVYLTWDWGSLILDPTAGTYETVGDDVLVRTDGPGTFGGREEDAHLLIQAPGCVVVLDAGASIAVRDGGIHAAAPAADIDPRAGVVMFLGLLILTALMMRHTRRSIGAR